ncbi:MAG: hypothetical protein WA632_10775 [Gallionella sp.]
MSTSNRYHVLPGKDGSTVLIYDSHTGAIQYPACWQDLAAYYNYLLGRGRIEESQKLLADCMSGSKPITAMLNKLSNFEAAVA